MSVSERLPAETARPQTPMLLQLMAVPCLTAFEHEHATVLSSANIRLQVSEHMLSAKNSLAKVSDSCAAVGSLLPAKLTVESPNSVAKRT